MKQKYSMVALAMLAAFLLSCVLSGTDVKAAVKAKKITLSSKTEHTFVGGGFTLKVKSVKPSKASKAVEWKSSNKKIATVTKKGKVQAKKSGTTVITATSKTNPKVKAKCKVKVYKATKRLVLSCADRFVLKKGDTQKLSAKIMNPKSGAQPVYWRSKNEAVAKVNTGGLVTAVAAGKAVIVGKSGKKSVQVQITVEQDTTAPTPNPNPNPNPNPVPGEDVIEVAEIRASISGTILEVGGTAQITASVVPENATDKTLRYTSSNPAAASVTEAGLVQGISPGSAEITVSSVNGKTASFAVTVIKGQGGEDLVPVTGVILDVTELTLDVGGTAVLAAKVVPENATNKLLYWESEDPNIVSVTQEGSLTGHRPGSARIRVRAFYGNGEEAYCHVTVEEKKEDEGEGTYTVIFLNGGDTEAKYPCNELPTLPDADPGKLGPGYVCKGWSYLSGTPDKLEHIPYDPKTFVPEKGKIYTFVPEWEAIGVIDGVYATKTGYYVGDRIDPATLSVTIIIGDRKETASLADLAIEPEIVTASGTFSLYVTYKPTGSTARCELNGVEVIPTELTAAYHGTGRIGEKLKNDDFTVTVLYNNKKSEEVMDFVIVSPKSLKEGENIVEILYEDVTATCTVIGVLD